MIQTAIVKRIIDDRRAEVEVKRQSACGHDCSKCGGGCSEMMVQTSVAVVAENLVRATPGDTVTVESSTQKILGAAVVVYLVPFFLFFAGYFICAALELTTATSVIAGGLGFALGMGIAVMQDRRIRRNKSISFRITGIESAT